MDLPESDERLWLLEELAELVRRRGAATLMDAPLVEPSDHFFPDRWQPDAAGVERLIRRLLGYAGLARLRVELSFFRNETRVDALDMHGRTSAWSHEGTAAWFAGIEDGVCHFGCDQRQLQDPVTLAGVLAHEVAHAYRTQHFLVVRNRDLEERLTDLTTVYLGFGLLTTNNAYRYRASGGVEETRWSHGRAGYLSPQALSYLLAAHTIVRGGEERRVRRLLEPDQAVYFAVACRSLRGDDAGAELGECLGVSPRPRPAGFWARLFGR